MNLMYFNEILILLSEWMKIHVSQMLFHYDQSNLNGIPYI